MAKKTAEHIIVQFKDKIKPLDYILPNEAVAPVKNTNIDEAVVALTSLGLSKNEATRIVKEVALNYDSSETIVAKALHNLGK